jgi:hypothetical protein
MQGGHESQQMQDVVEEEQRKKLAECGEEGYRSRAGIKPGERKVEGSGERRQTTARRSAV